MMHVARVSAVVALDDGDEFVVRTGRAYDDSDERSRLVIDKYADWFDSGLGDDSKPRRRTTKAS